MHTKAELLAEALTRLGFKLTPGAFFDTIHIRLNSIAEARAILDRTKAAAINLRDLQDSISISLDETTTMEDVAAIVNAFAGKQVPIFLYGGGDDNLMA